MKYLPITIIIIFAILTSCNKGDLPIEMIAYNGLSDEEKNLILVSPKDSSIEKVIVDSKIKTFLAKNYFKEKIYKVTFNHSETKSFGKLVVFIDLDKETVVGKGYDNLK